MLKITLLRHGKTEGNLTGKYISFTDEPLLEEEEIYLKSIKLPEADMVFCSPMQRCVQTAKILYPYVKPVIVSSLTECRFGLFEGKTYKELSLNPDYKKWIDSGKIETFPDGENRKEFRERCVLGFESVIRQAQDAEKSHIALIVHGGTIMSILELYGFPKQEYSRWHVGAAEGYRLRINAESFLDKSDRTIIVDGKIVRP